MAKTHTMTAKRKVALRKAQRASARKRRRRGGSKRRTAVKILAGGAVIGAAAYGYHKAPKHVKGHVKYHAKASAGFVGHMVSSPQGAMAHAQAVAGALQGKKHSINFLHSSYNWEKMRRASGGRRMYSVG